MKEKNCSDRGFSLMEVVIAVAIFASGLVILVAMIPQNLDDMRSASSKSMARRIAQNIIGELMLNEWERMHLFNSTSSNDSRYFDAQGIELSNYSVDTIFTARVKVLPRDVNLDQNRTLETVGVSVNNHSLPDDSVIRKSTSQHARRVIVEVTDVPKENFDFDDPENRNRFLRVGTVIANLNDVDVIE